MKLPMHNTVATTRQQLTGLSDGPRSRTVVIAANGTVSTAESTFNPQTMELTVTRRSDDATPSIGVSMFGHLISHRTLNESVHSWFDPFGRVYYFVVSHPVTDEYLYDRWMEFDDSGNEVYHDAYYNDLFITGSKAFDAFNRATTRTDALGNTVTTVYDVLGRPIATDGATYPVTHGYDTAGRAISLSTTRDGNSWDTTQWGYDARTGLNISKTYADDTQILYSHTPDGKHVRTTWARGAWREITYNERQLLNTISYSDYTPEVGFAYDTFGYPVTISNAVTSYTYQNSLLGIATNETATVDSNVCTLTRQLDARHHLAEVSMYGHLHTAYSYDVESRFAVVSNDAFSVSYAYANDGWDAGYAVALTNGAILSRTVNRDPYRRSLVTGVSNAVAGAVVSDYRYDYDLLGRAISRNDDSFGYNARSEVTFAAIATNDFRYAFDGIGNNQWTTVNGTTNAYTANALNQYETINTVPLAYDPDGNLLTNGVWSYVWDAENRLVAAYSNAALIVSNTYDHQSRRALKITPMATHTFVYDGWNLSQEIIHSPQATTTNRYVWGKDLSGTLQGAGGVGGLLAVSLNRAWYFPFYDNNGNITAYMSEQGATAAEYTYDAFGCTITKSGLMASIFPHRFSTKYYDTETGLYHYGHRFYAPELIRWIGRDPSGERSDANLYGFVRNAPVVAVDALGLRVFVVLGDDHDRNRQVITSQFKLIQEGIRRVEAAANRLKAIRPNAKYYFDGELLTGGYEEFKRRLEREKDVQISYSSFDTIAGEVSALSDSVNQHEYDGDVTLYVHHGIRNDPDDGTYTVKLKSNLHTPINTLADAVAGVSAVKGTLIHNSCYIDKVASLRPMRSFLLLRPPARSVMKAKLEQGELVEYEDTAYWELYLDDCWIWWGSTRVQSRVLPQ